ncbi:hypothetical protein ANN_26708 [Periplaneta americana]|uniref:Uncharacterized protein n=1 Tax=Periplaneta americana TaxID=6978 RepID=A0ABQ8RYV3_PERAM|nr:hypothetical protein ANN_26708 [Periplaneta americana]
MTHFEMNTQYNGSKKTLPDNSHGTIPDKNNANNNIRHRANMGTPQNIRTCSNRLSQNKNFEGNIGHLQDNIITISVRAGERNLLYRGHEGQDATAIYTTGNGTHPTDGGEKSRDIRGILHIRRQKR